MIYLVSSPLDLVLVLISRRSSESSLDPSPLHSSFVSLDRYSLVVPVSFLFRWLNVIYGLLTTLHPFDGQ